MTISDDVPDTSPIGEPAICTASRALVGLTAPSQEYAAIVAPGETPERAAEMMRESGCALVWRGMNGGEAPYRDGEAFGDVWALAGGSPWQPGGRVRLPRIGDMPELGYAIVYDAHGGFPQHLDLCWLVDGRAVAGGQRTGAGLETIAIVERDLQWIGGRLVDAHTGRPVMALIAPAG